jgi:hypothetical protein
MRVIVRQALAPVVLELPHVTSRAPYSRGCLAQLWDACIQLTYECAAAPENAADPVGTTCRRMLPHLLTSILGWRFADGDDGWSPRHVPYNQSNQFQPVSTSFNQFHW